MTLKNFNNDNSIFFVILEVIIFSIGFVFLLRSLKSYILAKERALTDAEKTKTLQVTDHSRFEQMSDAIEEYGKASAQRDKLKILQYAATEDPKR